ncbi:yhdP domain protein [Candidatus Erwinia dacicola]|uniref:YhdP domain protein n=1 Tax=Candidatus Erwinia dacicola TaxID=252393 RepID=A0A328TKC5_9GAMM|nr:yhdP domain protein [Candidatus Erwinia dacicola]
MTDSTPSGDTLTLANDRIDSGNTHLTVNGEWVNKAGEQRTSLKGVLSGKKSMRPPTGLASRRHCAMRRSGPTMTCTGALPRCSLRKRR